jgi:transcription antitermination factor NusG
MADSIDVNLGRHAMELAEQEWGSLKPLGPHFAALMEPTPEPMCHFAGHWYVFSFEPRRHELCKFEIAKKGLVPFVPMIPTRENHGRGSMRSTYRPMFGNYGFVRCDLTHQNFQSIVCSRGVRSLLAFAGKPACISDAEMEVIRLVQARKYEIEKMCADLDEAEARAKAGGRSGIIWHFSAGDRVRITKGPFAGFYAELEAAVDEHDRIRALVKAFGAKSKIELSAFDIEAL